MERWIYIDGYRFMFLLVFMVGLFGRSVLGAAERFSNFGIACMSDSDEELYDMALLRSKLFATL